MASLARMLIGFGVLAIVLGLVMLGLSKIGLLPFGKLPGDIVIRKPHFQFYFPIMTSILLSIVATAALYLFSLLRK